MKYRKVEDVDLIEGVRKKHKDDSNIKSIVEAKVLCAIGDLAEDTVAMVKRVTDLWKVLGVTGDYVILLNENIWGKLNAQQKEAIIYHELLHCLGVVNKQGELKYKIVKHDIEEFGRVVAQYGPYLESVKAFLEEAKKAQK
jgi:predicted metallopeptidase